jgi:hypothetical protein
VEELAKYLRAMLLLNIRTAQHAAERSGLGALKIELLLADSGFSNKEIADLLGKSFASVAKAVTRGRAARRGDQGEVDPNLGENENGQ